MGRSIPVLKLGVVVLVFMAGVSIVALAGGMQKVIVRPGTRPIPMQASASGNLSVSVVNLTTNALLPGTTAGPAVLDLGSVSYAGSHNSNIITEQKKNSFVVTTTFGLLVKDTSRHTGFATVSAYVSSQSLQLTYRVDGRKLSSIPTVISVRHPIGGVSRHNLEVEIPNSLTERFAQQQVALQFEVTPN
jgi:hypothetical protein